MTKVYIGLDAHKASILIALAFAGRSDPELYGKVSADLDAFLKILRRIMEGRTGTRAEQGQGRTGTALKT